MPYTATRLLAADPEKYQRAVALMQDGTPDRQIARALKMFLHTVHAIRQRERERLAPQPSISGRPD